jgi:hypothetical protein
MLDSLFPDLPGTSRSRHRPGRRPKPRLEPRACELCKEVYQPAPRTRGKPPQRFCSKSCARAWNNGARPPYLKVPKIEKSRAARRARRLRHAQTWDGISDEEIWERDGWRCQIPGCKRRPIRRDLKYPHPRSKSIDHIVPLSFGGDDSAENKRAAHLSCNVRRGNQVQDEQLALIGALREAPLASLTVGERVARAQVHISRGKCECGEPSFGGKRVCRKCWTERQAQRRAEIEQRRRERERQRTARAAERERQRTARAAEREAKRSRVCVVATCERMAGFDNGYCVPHYLRWKKFGEVFEDIPIARDPVERYSIQQLIKKRLDERRRAG